MAQQVEIVQVSDAKPHPPSQLSAAQIILLPYVHLFPRRSIAEMSQSELAAGLNVLPTEVIDPILLCLDIHTLSKIYLHIPYLKSQAATALNIHIKSLVVTIGSLDVINTTTLHCDKNLSTSGYLYYFRFFTDGRFGLGSFQDDNHGLQLGFYSTQSNGTTPKTNLLTLRCDSECHRNNCPHVWHTSVLKPVGTNGRAQSDPATHEHRFVDSVDVQISVLMFHLDRFVDCCNLINKDGRVALSMDEGVHSAYLRRLMER